MTKGLREAGIRRREGKPLLAGGQLRTNSRLGAVIVAGLTTAILSCCPALGATPATKLVRPDCTHPASLEAADLCEQWRAAKAAERAAVAAERANRVASWQFKISMLEALALVATLGASLYAMTQGRAAARAATRGAEHAERAATAAIEANAIAVRTAAEERRAWLKVDVELVSDLTWANGEGRYTLRVRLENVGSSPAFKVDLETRTSLNWGGQFLDELEELVQRSGRPGFGEHTIFPGQTFTFEARQFVPPQQIDEHQAWHDKGWPSSPRDVRDALQLIPLVCVSYKSLDEVRQTYAAFILRRITAGTDARVGPNQGRLARNEIHLDWAMGTGWRAT